MGKPTMNPFPGMMRWIRLLGPISLIFIVLLVIGDKALADEYLVYVGTYTGKGSEGIYAYRFDPATGGSVSVGLAAASDNPSFLAVDPRGGFLYAVNELEMFQKEPTGAVSVLAIDRESSQLKLL
jgi:6-phosphogluconolactonase